LRSKVFSAVAIGLALSACAGRDPAPIASVQAQDVYADCTMIRAEIEANNTKMTELADERGWKVTQNVAAGLAGFVVPVIWFGVDWKGAADKDAAALQARQQYLRRLPSSVASPVIERRRPRHRDLMCRRLSHRLQNLSLPCVSSPLLQLRTLFVCSRQARWQAARHHASAKTGELHLIGPRTGETQRVTGHHRLPVGISPTRRA